MQLWLHPKEVEYPHTERVDFLEFSPFTLAKPVAEEDTIKTIKIEYIKVPLKNCELPYVYVLDGFLDYFFETYNIYKAD